MSAQDLRTSRKLATMRHVQDVAITLFERRGFDAVTVEEVAREAEVGAASVFRNFGTKEALVLWDEYDPGLLEAIGGALRLTSDPLDAVLRALIAQVGEVYARDRRRILRRADLVAKTPALASAARLGVHLLRAELERLLTPHVKARLRRTLLAAVIASTLEIAVEEWRRLRSRVSLAVLLQRSFRLLERL